MHLLCYWLPYLKNKYVQHFQLFSIGQFKHKEMIILLDEGIETNAHLDALQLLQQTNLLIKQSLDSLLGSMNI